MQKITSLVSVAEIAPYMDEKVLNYIRAGQLKVWTVTVLLRFGCLIGMIFTVRIILFLK